MGIFDFIIASYTDRLLKDWPFMTADAHSITAIGFPPVGRSLLISFDPPARQCLAQGHRADRWVESELGSTELTEGIE